MCTWWTIQRRTLSWRLQRSVALDWDHLQRKVPTCAQWPHLTAYRGTSRLTAIWWFSRLTQLRRKSRFLLRISSITWRKSMGWWKLWSPIITWHQWLRPPAQSVVWCQKTIQSDTKHHVCQIFDDEQNVLFLNLSICAGRRGKNVPLFYYSEDEGVCSEYKGVGRESHAVSFHDAGSFISWELRPIAAFWRGKGLLGSFLALIVLTEFNLDTIFQKSSECWDDFS